MTQLIKEELNVKKIEIKIGKGELSVELDTQLTPDLIAEGKARELIRDIQMKRKELGCGLTERVIITLPDWPKSCSDYIRKETLANEIKKGNTFSITRV